MFPSAKWTAAHPVENQPITTTFRFLHRIAHGLIPEDSMVRTTNHGCQDFNMELLKILMFVIRNHHFLLK